MKNVIITILCVVMAGLIVGSWAMRQLTIRDNTIAILNYHLGQLRQQQQPMVVQEAPVVQETSQSEN